MRAYLLPDNKKSLSEALRRVGVSGASEKIFRDKSKTFVVELHPLKASLCNIVKQTMLSAKGDAAVHRDATRGIGEELSLLLLGTKRVFDEFLAKLRHQGYPTLNLLADTVESVLQNSLDVPAPIALKSGKSLSFELPLVMGILNLTPDSFFDGGRLVGIDAALYDAEKKISDGADILDIGGESTRPGAEKVSEADEIARVVPVVEAIKARFDIPVSVDTTKSEVAKRSLDVGADIINDISALTFDEKMAGVCASYACPVILMHIQGKPENMQENPEYSDTVAEVFDWLSERVGFAAENGIARRNVILDVGIGFGKRLEDNLRLIREHAAFKAFGLPLLVGASRKSMIGAVLGEKDPNERLVGTLATHLTAVQNGADIVRVHDVKEHVKLIKMLEALHGIKV